jgi:ketosteroid isomerase-like protein
VAISILLALGIAAAPLASQSTPDAAAIEFLDAFKSMDQARFDQFFAPDVTMFFPGGPFPEKRVEGREAVLAAFHKFFVLAKERGRSALNIAPLDQQVQVYGDVAVVSFELESDETLGRRSIILRKIGNDWRIAHFHASSIDK